MELELKLESELGAMVAITVLIISVFATVVKLKDENVIQGMQRTQVATVDTWNQYQAERIKMTTDENDANALNLTAPSHDAVSKEVQRLQDKISHYQKESEDLSKVAHGDEKLYETLEYRHDQFDMADALCSLALALSAIAALAGRRSLLIGGWVAAGLGVALGLAGLFGWNLHPEWLASFLG
ncbi:MAG TPA: DUF4337 domain-containing protein [Rhizomicrobium sp.]|jgi:hypothetical protein